VSAQIILEIVENNAFKIRYMGCRLGSKKDDNYMQVGSERFQDGIPYDNPWPRILQVG
jgi:hypothetical protein